MPEVRTLPISAEHREFTVKVDGQAVERVHQLLSVSIAKVADKISSARLVYQDGSASASSFSLSNSSLFIPGKEIEILVEYADKVKKVGEINYYSKERIKEIEMEHFGLKGLLGFLGKESDKKQEWPF